MNSSLVSETPALRAHVVLELVDEAGIDGGLQQQELSSTSCSTQGPAKNVNTLILMLAAVCSVHSMLSLIKLDQTSRNIATYLYPFVWHDGELVIVSIRLHVQLHVGKQESMTAARTCTASVLMSLSPLRSWFCIEDIQSTLLDQQKWHSIDNSACLTSTS